MGRSGGIWLARWRRGRVLLVTGVLPKVAGGSLVGVKGAAFAPDCGRADRDELWSFVSKRRVELPDRRTVGMAGGVDLVVCGAADAAAADLDGRV